MRRALFVLSFLLLACSGISQSTQPIANQPGGIEAVVTEVRQLRKDLQTAKGCGPKAQILLDPLQVQEAAIGRVAEHLNDARSRLS